MRLPGDTCARAANTAGPVLVSRWPTAMAVPVSPGEGPSWYQPTSLGLSSGGVSADGSGPTPMATIGASIPSYGTRRPVAGGVGSGFFGGVGLAEGAGFET